MTSRIGYRPNPQSPFAPPTRRDLAEPALAQHLPSARQANGALAAQALSRLARPLVPPTPADVDGASTLVGSCLCGAVRYEVHGPLEKMSHCHCSICRKHHGSSFSTFVTASRAGFRWLEGASLVETYQSSPFGQRCFCKVCGSVAPIVEAGADVVFCPAGALEGKLGVKPQRHLFVGSKARWHTISDDLPQCVEV